MKRVRIINLSKDEVVLENGLLADKFFNRLKGLMAKKKLEVDEGLCIYPCNSVHTCFMRFNIDVIFVDKSSIVCKIIKGLKPWKSSGFVKNAKYVIEIQTNSNKDIEVECGDKLNIIYVKN